MILVPLVNWSFTWAPLWELPDGSTWTPMTIVTGLVLVVRDLAQREIGHRVLGLLLVGTALSYFMAAPTIAIASGLAFLISESVDWAVYTFTKRPLSQRILLSSLLSAPLDTTLFLYGAELERPGILTGWAVATSAGSKIAGAIVVAYMVYRHEQRQAKTS